MTQPLIIDGHLDLAMNAVLWNRDLTQPLEAIREREAEKADKPDRGRGVVSFDEMKRGNIGICIATQIGHSVSQNSPLEGWHSAEIAWAQTQAQLAWYRVMEENGVMAAITDLQSMDRQLQRWNDDSDNCPLGYILSLEGGDSMLTLQYLDRAYEYGLRAVGPAHYGPGRYSPGTGEEGPLEPAGRELVKRMAELGMALDVTHLTDKAFWEALEIFDGVCWASHSNCRSLVPAQ
jgi:membrane dipeptidase